MFELDPGKILNYTEVFNTAGSLTFVYMGVFLIYNKVRIGEFTDSMNENIYPAGLVVYFALTLAWLLRGKSPGAVAAGVLLAPFAKVTMFSSFVGDWFTSLVKLLEDGIYTAFFIGSGRFLNVCIGSLWVTDSDGDCVDHGSNPLLVYPVYQNVLRPFAAFLPLWCRLAQNLRRYHDTHNRFPHLANALKYGLSLTVVFFGSFSPQLYDLSDGSDAWTATFVVCCIGSTLYAIWWDVRMDWGLLGEQLLSCLLYTSPSPRDS
eukprot:TRINITY_DN45279_c0_g1_i2.p1 TRINITY_DN45279_c0_g1~~TRINITY_DN45279_c0_g1_i2.p1  ORF type:complete len:262 (+),score=52.28 TRINITY_DN45279_c0_g1_i2:538-1323(+)